MATELVAERARCDFDQQELAVHLAGGQHTYDEMKQVFDDFGKYPETANHFDFYSMNAYE